jgi:hypothetical protein
VSGSPIYMRVLPVLSTKKEWRGARRTSRTAERTMNGRRTPAKLIHVGHQGGNQGGRSVLGGSVCFVHPASVTLCVPGGRGSQFRPGYVFGGHRQTRGLGFLSFGLGFPRGVPRRAKRKRSLAHTQPRPSYLPARPYSYGSSNFRRRPGAARQVPVAALANPAFLESS